jgi:hypothetical protein
MLELFNDRLALVLVLRSHMPPSLQPVTLLQALTLFHLSGS